MKSSEIRKTFLDYFARNGHQVVPSSSLIPENDPTLLFANAGMNQFKNLFLGLEHRPYKRAVSSQKCVRAGGKHNDLDNVGFTARHHTFFEMLGNFSFGDYFKKDAIHFAWELLTKEFGIPKEKLYVTVFREDDEAADIWHQQEGIPRDRIFRFDEKDNFWRMGDIGPCGPCTEIFYDHGPLAGKISDPFKGIAAGEDRFVEIWNLVFMQFDEKAPGQMEKLPKPSVDTGSGLERVVAALQGRYNNYNTDLFAPMLNVACKTLGWNLNDMIDGDQQLRQNPSLEKVCGRSQKQFREDLAALRVLADHTRSTSFLIADGALPSNEGRGYVLRRILRRAVRFGRKLSEHHSFLNEMSIALIEQMSPVYPELKQRQSLILQTIQDEEKRFLVTLDQGTSLLNQEIEKLQRHQQKVLPGEIVFKLYDSFGFPADLTTLIAQEQGLGVDQVGFEKRMESARSRSKSSWKGSAIQADEKHLLALAIESREKYGPTKFVGYNELHSSGKILSLSDGTQSVQQLAAGSNGIAIVDSTTFYAESGGQVGDHGMLVISNGGGNAVVHDCTKLQDMHLLHIEVREGTLRPHTAVESLVENKRRQLTMANHSATHLMHSALRKILGDHVTQAGSVVDPDRLRFDFTHPKPLSTEEIAQIEALVNEQISDGLEVKTDLMNHKDAIKAGAMALFGEKYGEQVRVLTMGQFSCELCGGTHVRNTSQIRLFKIVSEGGVSAGVRRIEAITSDAALNYLLQQNQLAQNVKQATNSVEPLVWIENQKEQIRHLEKEIKRMKGNQVSVDQILLSAKTFKDSSQQVAKLCSAILDIDDREVMAKIVDQLKDRLGRGVVVILGENPEGHPLIVSVSKDLTGSIKAGDLLKDLAGQMGGKGGGRPDFAQGSVPRRDHWQNAIVSLEQKLKAQ